jgi:putative ABC transport system substrate-binding protein
LLVAAAGALAQEVRKAGEFPSVGFLFLGSQVGFRERPNIVRFIEKMRELGWREGENIRYLGRGARGDLQDLEGHAGEFVRDRVAIIVSFGPREVLGAKRASTTIPIVMVHPSDPVALGIVSSLNRPGGNITGNYSAPLDLYSKRVEFLAEILAGVRRVAFAHDSSSSHQPIKQMEDAAKKRGISTAISEIPADGRYDDWIAKLKRDGTQAILLAHSASVFPPERRRAVVAALIKHQMPAICYAADYVESGCLASYGASNADLFASAAAYADKILRGAKPGELPIQAPTVYELVLNLKTA